MAQQASNKPLASRPAITRDIVENQNPSQTEPQQKPKQGIIDWVKSNKITTSLSAVLVFSLGAILNFFGSNPRILYLPAFAASILISWVIMSGTHKFIKNRLSIIATTPPTAPALTIFAVPQQDYIEGTEVTRKALDKFFPFGSVVFFYGQNRILRNEIFSNGMMEWTIDVAKVKIEPDFTTGKVKWEIPPVSIVSTNSKLFIHQDFVNSKMIIMGELKNGAFAQGPFDFGNNPVLYVATLSDNQLHPVFALGYRIPTPDTSSK